MMCCASDEIRWIKDGKESCTLDGSVFLTGADRPLRMEVRDFRWRFSCWKYIVTDWRERTPAKLRWSKPLMKCWCGVLSKVTAWRPKLNQAPRYWYACEEKRFRRTNLFKRAEMVEGATGGDSSENFKKWVVAWLCTLCSQSTSPLWRRGALRRVLSIFYPAIVLG